MKQKLNKLEKYWVMYDVGNSAFTLLVSTIIPIYFNFLAEEAGLSNVQYLAYWGYAASAATLLVAVLAAMTAWMLIANWRQSRRRQSCQRRSAHGRSRHCARKPSHHQRHRPHP
mgnify:CR=1 FL=1